MDKEAIRYALAKQLSSAVVLDTDYGAIELDAELAEAVDKALRPILKWRLTNSEIIDESQ